MLKSANFENKSSLLIEKSWDDVKYHSGIYQVSIAGWMKFLASFSVYPLVRKHWWLQLLCILITCCFCCCVPHSRVVCEPVFFFTHSLYPFDLIQWAQLWLRRKHLHITLNIYSYVLLSSQLKHTFLTYFFYYHCQTKYPVLTVSFFYV